MDANAEAIRNRLRGVQFCGLDIGGVAAVVSETGGLHSTSCTLYEQCAVNQEHSFALGSHNVVVSTCEKDATLYDIFLGIKYTMFAFLGVIVVTAFVMFHHLRQRTSRVVAPSFSGYGRFAASQNMVGNLVSVPA